MICKKGKYIKFLYNYTYKKKDKLVMYTQIFIFFVVFFILFLIVKRINIKKQKLLNLTKNLLIIVLLYSLPIFCIKVFDTFCDYYEPEISGFTYAVWYFIIY